MIMSSDALKTTLLKEYAYVFKTQLSRDDRIDIAPVTIETVDNYKSFKPVNHMTPTKTKNHGGFAQRSVNLQSRKWP